MTKWSRYLMAAVLAAFIFFLFYSGVDSGKSAQAVFTDMGSAVHVNTMEEKTRRELLRYYGINSVDVDSFVLYAAPNSLDASEMLLIKAKNEIQLQEIRSKVEERQAARLAGFDSYDAEQAEILRNAVLEIRGPFLLYIAGEDVKSAEQAFAKAVK